MGNGCLTAIDERVKFSHFFNKNEILTYKNSNDLIKKIIKIKDNSKMLKRISKNGKKNILNYSQTLLLVNF